MLKIATYNINGIRSRSSALLEWLRREAPDIVCLQELKAPDPAFPADAIREAGYGAIWHGQVSWNGVAILAKGMDPIESRRGLPGDKGDTQSRYIEAAAHGVPVSSERQPAARTQIRLQARVVRAADRLCRRAPRQRSPGGARG
jgi:exodeoxyribonuclease-3